MKHREINNKSTSTRKSKDGWLNFFLINLVTLTLVPFTILLNNCYARDNDTKAVVLDYTLPPQITVEAINPHVRVTARSLSEDIKASVDFAIESNTPQVDLYFEATDFHLKKELGTTPSTIKLSEKAGVEIDINGASISGGNVKPYAGNGENIDGFASKKTGVIRSKTDRGDLYQHIVTGTFTWTHDTLKPAGRYEARLQLTCIAISEAW